MRSWAQARQAQTAITIVLASWGLWPASYQRLGTTLQGVSQNPYRACSQRHFSQRVAQLLLCRRIGTRQRTFRTFHDSARGGQGAPRFFERCFQIRYRVCIQTLHQPVRIFQRLVERLQRLCRIGAKCFERHFVYFREHAGQFVLQVRQCTRCDRKLRSLRIPVWFCLWCCRKIIESDIQLPGEQIRASELSAQATRLDKVLHQGAALECVLTGFDGGCLLLEGQSRYEPLGEQRNRDSGLDIKRRWIERHAYGCHFTRGQAEERNGRAHRQALQRFPEA